MEIVAHISSAFSKNESGGNKAGVIFLDNDLIASQKINIAKQLGYSETAFISKSKNADYKLAYFTPKEEVDLCGHATIATFLVLNHLKKIMKKRYTIETNCGLLEVYINEAYVYMEQNIPMFYDEILPVELTQCFSINSMETNFPIQIVSTGLKDILVPILSEQALQALKPNFEKIKLICSEYNAVGMHLFAFNNNRIICRNFAPLYDIDEESATGTSNCALAAYLYKHNFLRKNEYVFDQGYSLNRPSEIIVKLNTTNQGDIHKIFVGGKGYYCGTKHLNV